ncbi:high mobility group protein DSP1-like [Drosophila montana]|uniref:high mobility group protein DSP1-like n=1 Tax=Drosophila montana TaxID=40370 RepID=UPI00313DE325
MQTNQAHAPTHIHTQTYAKKDNRLQYPGARQKAARATATAAAAGAGHTGPAGRGMRLGGMRVDSVLMAACQQQQQQQQQRQQQQQKQQQQRQPTTASDHQPNGFRLLTASEQRVVRAERRTRGDAEWLESWSS